MGLKKQEFFFLINSLRLGGAEKNCVNLANALTENGHKVSIIVMELREAVLADNLSPDVSVINLEVAHARQSLFRLKSTIEANQIRQILVFTFQLSVVLVMIRKLWKMDLHIVARSINSLGEKFKHEKSFWHKWVSQYLIKRWFFDVDHIIAQSTGMKNELESLKGKSEVPVTVIFNFLDQIPVQTQPLNTEKSNMVLFVGKLKAQKNLFFLIDAFEIALKSNPDLQLCLVGDGDQKQDLENHVFSKGLEHNVSLVGKSQNVAQYYKQALVCVLSSHYEGFPNVLIEANSYGLPVVSLDCPSGPSDIILPYINGILVVESTKEAFAAAIIDAIQYEWEKEAISRSVFRFSKEKAVEAYLQILQRPLA